MKTDTTTEQKQTFTPEEQAAMEDFRTRNAQRIVLRVTQRHCHISGRRSILYPLAFFLDGDYSQPVDQAVALQLGFTVSKEDWHQINDMCARTDRAESL